MGQNVPAKARKQIQALNQQIQELRRQLAAPPQNTVAVPPPMADDERVSWIESLCRFAESGLSLTALGIIGPLMIPISNWFLALPAACFALAFHRNKVVRGRSIYVQIPSYILLLSLGAAAGWGIHVSIQKTEDELISRIGALFQKSKSELVATRTPVTTTTPASNMPSPRSYLAYIGSPGFPGALAPNSIGRDFQLGEQMLFNVFYKNTGPNSVSMLMFTRIAVLEPVNDEGSQKKALAYFNRLNNNDVKVYEKAKVKPTPLTMMPGDTVFFSVYVLDSDEKTLHLVNQTDLDAMKLGTKVPFVMSIITYRDHNQIHHLRRCMWLQPPEQPNGVWHYCDFPDSD